MKIAIVGSRNIPNNVWERKTIRDFIFSKINVKDIDCVISGGALGVDKLAYEFYKSEEIFEYKEYNPRWKFYGNHTGAYIRNKKIVEESDIIFIFWSGLETSKGSKMDIRLCKEMNKKHYIYNYKEEKEKNEEQQSLPRRKAKI